MEKDSIIVPGGELDVGLLENVVSAAVPAATTPATVPKSLSPIDFGDYTLGKQFLLFLEKFFKVNTSTNLFEYSTIKNPTVKEVIQNLGTDLFTLDYLTLVKAMNIYGAGNNQMQYLIADLKLTPSIPKQSFQKGLASLLGDEETMKYFLSTDIAQALGLDDPTKPVDLNDPSLHQLFPSIVQIKELNGTYVIPADPYILLLAVEPQYRRFLSACFDQTKKNQGSIFSLLNGKEYNSQELSKYGFSILDLQGIVRLGFLDLATIVKTGKQFGLTQLKSYLDSMATLNDGLKNMVGP